MRSEQAQEIKFLAEKRLYLLRALQSQGHLGVPKTYCCVIFETDKAVQIFKDKGHSGTRERGGGQNINVS